MAQRRLGHGASARACATRCAGGCRCCRRRWSSCSPARRCSAASSTGRCWRPPRRAGRRGRPAARPGGHRAARRRPRVGSVRVRARPGPRDAVRRPGRRRRPPPARGGRAGHRPHARARRPDLPGRPGPARLPRRRPTSTPTAPSTSCSPPRRTRATASRSRRRSATCAARSNGPRASRAAWCTVDLDLGAALLMCGEHEEAWRRYYDAVADGPRARRRPADRPGRSHARAAASRNAPRRWPRDDRVAGRRGVPAAGRSGAGGRGGRARCGRCRGRAASRERRRVPAHRLAAVVRARPGRGGQTGRRAHRPVRRAGPRRRRRRRAALRAVGPAQHDLGPRHRARAVPAHRRDSSRSPGAPATR